MYKSNKNIDISVKPDFRSIPQEPGVYIYSSATKAILYVGKAKNLRSRLRSYFSLNLLEKTAKMMSEAKYLRFIKVTSELEALLLEAKLVRILNPYYNSALKDDKHPLYIKITKDKYPRVITVRKSNSEPFREIYGPFPSSDAVYSVLKMLRRVIPYSQHKLGKKACLYKQMGLCDPCPNEIETQNNGVKRANTRVYLKNISSLKKILDGKFTTVFKDMSKEMNNLSRKGQFEAAITVREQIKKLRYLTQPTSTAESYLENPNLAEDIGSRQAFRLNELLSPYFKIKNLTRIECFDVAHLSGVNPTASMVTYINSVPAKEYYRRFRIFQKKSNSDVDSLREVAQRRLKYLTTWGTPDLILIDGGKPQVSIFMKVFKDTAIPIIGLAKRQETLVIYDSSKFIQIKPKGEALFLVTKIRDEAHRFAQKYHHTLVAKSLLRNNN